MVNDFLDKKGHIGLNVVKSIIDYKINLLFVSRIGEISFHMLKDQYVDIFKVDKGMKVKEIITLYNENKLDPITKPDLSKQSF
jgi:predicted Fe-Mo cluster-binding NifX family protein